MGPTRLLIARSNTARLARLSLAGLAVLAWLGIVLADLFLTAMFSQSPSIAVALLTSPLLLIVPWIVKMADARGVVEVHHDTLVIRHPRVLRRPLIVPRAQVRRVLLDDGQHTGRARFATGDEHEPLLWTDPVPSRQHADRPLIGDGLLPNLAVQLEQPLPMDAARDAWSAVPLTREIDPPVRGAQARALLMAVEDLEAARHALAGWGIEQPVALEVIPPQVAAAAQRVPADAATVLLFAAMIAVFTIDNQVLGMLIFVPVAFLLVQRMTRRREAEGAAARAEVRRRAPFLTPTEVAAAEAVIEANLGAPPSQGPPGYA